MSIAHGEPQPQANLPSGHAAVGTLLGAHSSVDDSHVASLSTTRFRSGLWEWEVLSDWEPLLREGVAPNWMHLREWASARLVKCNPQREVWRLRLAGRPVYAKVYRDGSWLGRMKSLVTGPKCRREWAAAFFSLSHGLPAVRPVGFATSTQAGTRGVSVLLTDELPDAEPLDEYWRRFDRLGSAERLRQTRALIDAAADLLAKAHDAGFSHDDLHAANLLVQTAGGEAIRVAFVDLHGARIGVDVSEARARRNFVQLNQWFARHASRTERLRFLKQYLARRENGKREQRTWARKIETEAERHAAALWAKRDRRVVRDGTYFHRLHLPGGWKGHVALRCKREVAGSRASQLVFTAEQWSAWLADPTRYLTDVRPEHVLKDSHSGFVGRKDLPVEGQPLSVIGKRARPRTWVKRVWYWFRPPRALQTFRRGHALLNRELPTARPLAALCRRVAGAVVDELVITEAIPDTQDLDTLLRMRWLHETPARQRHLKRQLIDALVDLYRRMHDRGCHHRDMKAPNVLVRWSAEDDGRPRLTLVDLDGLRVRRRMGWSHRLATIMRLNVSLDPCRIVTVTDRLRFLKGYLAHYPAQARDWKPIWRRLAAASDHKRGRKAERTAWKLEQYGRV